MGVNKLLTSRSRALTPRALALGAVALGTLALAGCGAVKVQPTTAPGSAKLASRGKIDSPLTDMRNHLGCLRAAHLSVQVVSPTQLQVAGGPAAATIVFTSTPGAAQAAQIEGRAQAAEVIGAALVYPHRAPDAELTSIEDCLAQGVQG